MEISDIKQKFQTKIGNFRQKLEIPDKNGNFRQKKWKFWTKNGNFGEKNGNLDKIMKILHKNYRLASLQSSMPCRQPIQMNMSRIKP